MQFCSPTGRISLLAAQRAAIFLFDCYSTNGSPKGRELQWQTMRHKHNFLHVAARCFEQLVLQALLHLPELEPRFGTLSECCHVGKLQGLTGCQQFLLALLNHNCVGQSLIFTRHATTRTAGSKIKSVNTSPAGRLQIWFNPV